ncbi:MAG: archaetidylserine decarboxylase [Pseudomonadota bacterium]
MSQWFARLQNVLPQHGISRLAANAARSSNTWVSGQFIRQFAKAYNISLEEAQASSLDEFKTFNEFFTRALQEGARPIDPQTHAIVSPADGAISQMGHIEHDLLLQAKGHRYSLASLAGSLGEGFNNGAFCTIYLAPSDYHRVHLPFAGRLTDTLAIPGALFSVNASTEAGIPGLFARNERLVCRFETSMGPMLVVLVGAMIVASIATDWPGPASPYATEEHNTYDLNYDKGDEIGRFLLGSTVICCFPEGRVNFLTNLSTGSKVRMGEAIGELA